LLKLEIGKNYNFECEVTVQQPQTMDNGRTYPAKLQFRPIKVV
jgi:hypothetical protein